MMKKDFTNETILRNKKFSYYLDNRITNDLYLLGFGKADSSLTSITQDYVRIFFYSLHLVTGGHGYYKTKDNIFYLKKGDLFLLYPEHDYVICADQNDKWSFSWINFSGNKVNEFVKKLNIDETKPYISLDDENYEIILSDTIELIEGFSKKTSKDCFCLSKFLTICSNILVLTNIDIEEHNPSKINTYVLNAILYIENNYYKIDLTSQEITDYVGLERSYFSRLFRKETGKCLSNYITQYRLEKAKLLLNENKYLIKQVAKLVGYSDPLYFSKEFNRFFDMAPTKYSQVLLQNKLPIYKKKSMQ